VSALARCPAWLIRVLRGPIALVLEYRRYRVRRELAQIRRELEELGP
jgi:hypothetical protein